MDADKLVIDRDELARHIEELGAIGLDPETGGIVRLLYTPAWHEAVEKVRAWMDEAGLETWFDAVGNLHGRLEGREGGPVVMTGSHIDTVVQGGKYDGALGIHAGLCAVKALLEGFGQPRRSVEVVATCDEDGGRFATDYLGSRAVTGDLSFEELEQHCDESGVSAATAMQGAGFNPSALPQARRDDVAAWLELHIEQGPILESEGIDVGIVHTITGRQGVRVRVTGRQDHAGTTPMDMRRDPMAGAAEMISEAIRVAEAMGRPAVCTAGQLSADPGATNVVPAAVIFSLDLRDPDPQRFAELCERVRSNCAAIAEGRSLELTYELTGTWAPTPLHTSLQETILRAIEGQKLRYLSMPSMASHDTRIFAERWPSGMIFVPSRDGRSHEPEEFTSHDKVTRAVEIIAFTLYELAYE